MKAKGDIHAAVTQNQAEAEAEGALLDAHGALDVGQARALLDGAREEAEDTHRGKLLRTRAVALAIDMALAHVIVFAIGARQIIGDLAKGAIK